MKLFYIITSLFFIGFFVNYYFLRKHNSIDNSKHNKIVVTSYNQNDVNQHQVFNPQEHYTNNGIHIVCSHYKENLDWIHNIIKSHNNVSQLHIYDCGITDISNISHYSQVKIQKKEVKTTLYHYYFKYIYDHYHDLPDYILFCHSHNTDWHQKTPLNTVITMLNDLMPNFDYINISDKVYKDWYTPNKFLNKHVNTVINEHKQFFNDNFYNETNTNPLLLMEINAGECCVHKTRILQSPRYVWKYLRDVTEFKNHHETYDYGMEGLLHILFGEPAIRPYIQEHLNELTESTIGKNVKTRNELELLYFDIYNKDYFETNG